MAGARRLVYLVAEDWYFRLHFLALARAAREAGWDVVLLARTGQRGDHRAEIASAGIRLEPMAIERGRLDPLGDLRLLGAVARAYRRLAPDLVHHVALKPVVLGGLAARLAGVPSRLAMLPGMGHLFTSGAAPARLLRPAAALALRAALGGRCARAAVLNRDDRALLARLSGLSEGRVEVLPGTGVDLARFRPSPEPPRDADGRVTAVYVGRLLFDKGLAELVEAARRLAAAGAPVRLRLVGSPDPGNPSSVPEAMLRGWVADGLVAWAGPTDDVPAVWRQAHIAVLPSHREGLGMSLIEAAACGRPLVATDVPGCREAVRDGESGLLVPPHDPAALAAALTRLARDDGLRVRLGRAARMDAERRFALPIVTDRLLALYEAMWAESRLATSR